MGDIEAVLERIYYNPGNSGALSGPQKLYKSARSINQNISKKDVTKWLQNQRSFSIQSQPKRRINRPKVMAPFRHYQWEADSANMKSFADDNDGYQHFLVVIDVFSRYVWTFPLKSTTGKESAQIFNTLFKKVNPWRLRTDKGSEFTSKSLCQVVNRFNVLHIFTHNEVKAAFAERVIKTLKTLLTRFKLFKQSNRWLETLPLVTKTYNESYHRVIKQSPIDVDDNDADILWYEQHGPKIVRPRRPPSLKPSKFRYEINDIVRISLLKKTFEREYDKRWSDEYFIITGRFMKEKVPMYKLKDYNNDEIEGTFYEDEMKRICVDENEKYQVEKIIKTKKVRGRKEYFVKWVGWPSKFNTWVSEVDMTNI